MHALRTCLQVDAEKERLTYEVLMEQKRTASALQDHQPRSTSSAGSNSELADLLGRAHEIEPVQRHSAAPNDERRANSAFLRKRAAGGGSGSSDGYASSVMSDDQVMLSEDLSRRLDATLRDLAGSN